MEGHTNHNLERELGAIFTQLESLRESNKRLEQQITQLQTNIEDNYVTKDAFAPVRQITYSLVAGVGLSVLGALIALVLR